MGKCNLVISAWLEKYEVFWGLVWKGQERQLDRRDGSDGRRQNDLAQLPGAEAGRESHIRARCDMTLKFGEI